MRRRLGPRTLDGRMAKGKKRKAAPGDIATNRQASYRYELLDKLEAGMVLRGTEVKALRDGGAQIKDGYVTVEGAELWLQNVHIPPYGPAARANHDPDRDRKLLVHRRELERLLGKTRERGLTLVPTRLYFSGPNAKIELALARGKDVRDKREAIRARETKREMERALREANRAIFERTARESDKQGMGTTASVLVLAGESYLIGQVGDSRVYLLRDGQLRQLTKDHSYVQEQVDAGFLTPEQARYHPYSNVITRCVGASDDVEPDTFEGEVRRGDVFLVASDGLTGMVDDRRLQQLLGSRASPQRMVEALIAEANGRGGLDNITAIVVHVLDVDDDGRPSGHSQESPADR